MNNAARATTPQVVGTIHSPGSLRHALRLKPGAVDLLEVRIDHFAENPAPLRAALPRLGIPLLLTVRHPREGGSGNLSTARRMSLYREFLAAAGESAEAASRAAWIDLELRSAVALRPIAEEARAQSVGLILSQHYFNNTPSPLALKQELAEARRHGANLFKLAARTTTPTDVATLLSIFKAAGSLPVSVMGMGPLGKASRLLFARAGSRLNYGYLGEPQVSGQWPAELLKKRLEEVCSEA